MGQLWASPAPSASPVRLCHYDPSANSISFHCGLVGSEHGRLSWMVTAFFFEGFLEHGGHRVGSGKRLHSYGKSQFFMGKFTINGDFQ